MSSAMAEPETASRGGIVGWVASTDHKRIGLMALASSGAFLALGGLLALVMRAELARPGMQIVSRDQYNQIFTMHGSVMVYLVVTPLALALGVYLVPLQVGAAGIAWPRLTLASHWLIVSGGITMLAGFATQQGAGQAGWTAFYPLSGAQATPGNGMDLWIVGVMLAVGGSIGLGAAVLATILGLRAPGLTMLRLPVFTWTMLVGSLLVVLSFPVLVGAMGLLLADRHGVDVFGGAGGPAAYQNLFWFYGHPAVYVMFFPFLGAVAEIVAVSSGRRFFGYRGLVVGLLLFASLSMSVWAHHMFTTGQVTNRYFSFTSTVLAVPAGIEYVGAVGTMWGGSIRLRASMLFALAFLLQFLIGGLSGIITASPPLDYHVHDSYFIVAHFHYTLFAGSMFGAFAAIYHWFPKVTGALLREGLGKLHLLLLAVGTHLTFFPMFLLGWHGMPRRVADYAPNAGFTGANEVSTAGSAVIALAFCVFAANVVVSLRHRRPAGDDPWGGHTLEWATTAPPPRLNFTSLPPIRSEAPLLDRRELEVP